MKGARVFSSFLKQIIRTSSLQSAYYSSKSTIQSSVGVIFKCSLDRNWNNVHKILQHWRQIENVEMLMAQRAGFQKDANAYNVVFPGGQADVGQSDLQACKRQLMQQISLNTDKQCIYVGQIPQNFYYAKKRGRYVYISCHVWILKPQSSFQPKLNQDQLIDFRWVPLEQIINPDYLTLYSQKELGFFSRMGINIIKDNIKSNLQMVSFPGINVGLKRDLWGLTLWLLSYILQMSQSNLLKNSMPQLKQLDQQIVKNIDKIRENTKMLHIKFRRTYIPGYPMIWLAKAWHYAFRVRPFSYNKPAWDRYAFTVFATILFLIIVFSLAIR